MELTRSVFVRVISGEVHFYFRVPLFAVQYEKYFLQMNLSFVRETKKRWYARIEVKGRKGPPVLHTNAFRIYILRGLSSVNSRVLPTEKRRIA